MALCISTSTTIRRGSRRLNPCSVIRSWKPAFDFDPVELLFLGELPMASPIIVGAAVGTAALGTRYLLSAWQAIKARPSVPRARRFYPGGFEQVMTRREAALILGVREHAVVEKIREAHRRVMVANHPDAGGSHYLASKINEAKDVLLKRTKASGSAF
ncbi:mitochondrial import inner membrane translocase subunit TIM14-3-like isoform X2 [Andrographis paniculata]|uniref:mitochondrial import inner membrane translocase subunit TIM14-3-like isoform X2 n=1 Tax=Andrographis paniculata TaxID=175694 RepID=UPI0021E89A01|nr:mitochondrial import inner membrane translocase subunit TIM14-3-like isoform X2 [Andrographis paniculata]